MKERGMDRLNSPLAADQPRFAAYLEALSDVLGHADRIAPLKAYCMQRDNQDGDGATIKMRH